MSEMFYLDKDGKKSDAALHEAIMEGVDDTELRRKSALAVARTTHLPIEVVRRAYDLPDLEDPRADAHQATKHIHIIVDGRPKAGAKQLHLEWLDGELTGDPDAVNGLLRLAALQEGEPIGAIPAAYSTHDHLKNPLSFQILCHEWFEPGYQITGNPPPFPEYDPNLIY